MSKIAELAEKLPPNLEKEVIDFIEFLINKESKIKGENSKESGSISKLKGVFSKYADPSKIELEKKAWESYVKEKWSNLQ
ncbi:DUF2281 domain-containing protein [Hippea alviniae]|uniref:DUF2281 domain-containing protein n=1 Tax=Hippea alviniae TaxID=1279027 RepID=UPI0003FD478E|nr:DUF2281 domain-containing protein [Hippea alviniae]